MSKTLPPEASRLATSARSLSGESAIIEPGVRRWWWWCAPPEEEDPAPPAPLAPNPDDVPAPLPPRAMRGVRNTSLKADSSLPRSLSLPEVGLPREAEEEAPTANAAEATSSSAEDLDGDEISWGSVGSR